MKRASFFFFAILFVCAAFAIAVAQQANTTPKLKGYFKVKPAQGFDDKAAAQSGTSPLPLFVYNVTSSRDGNSYSGTMVGQDPFNSSSGTSNVPTEIIPLIVMTQRVGTGIDGNGIVSTTTGTTTFDPTAADTNCLAAPNDVPVTLFEQSPILQDAAFSIGSTSVGTTQYVDAFQRGNFLSVIGGGYHTLLHPAHLLPPVTIFVPEFKGVALPGSLFGSGFCTIGIMNFDYFDSLVTAHLPSLAIRGVNPGTFPIFLLYNVVLSDGAPTNLNLCCVLGYHGATTTASGVQTYSPMDFDMTGLFGSGVSDTSIAAHETAEWMDDPFGNNPVPAWGHIGQQAGCQGNLEVGDPLTGTNFPPVTMPNGFTYHLQELAFFSWFYGEPSIAANGWFSDNNTFTTDAGPPCQ